MNESVWGFIIAVIITLTITVVYVTSDVKRDCDKLGNVILYGEVYTCERYYD